MRWTSAVMLSLTAVVGCSPDLAGPDSPPAQDFGGPSYAFGGSLATYSSTWFQGFEIDAIDWSGTTRVSSGTNGIMSSTGAFHGEATSGASTRFNAYSSVWPGDYTTEIDVYLNPAWAVGQGFDYSVATNGTTNAHRRDFIFHVGVHADGRLLVNGSNNSDFKVNDFKLLNDGDGTPYHVTTAGWYTLQHVFYDDGGVLAVDLRLLNSSGAELFTTTRKDASDLIGSAVGGNRYGWFVFSTRTLAIDNQRRATAAQQVPSTVALTITPTVPVPVAHVLAVSGDAAPGFPGGSFVANAVVADDKSEMYFPPESLFEGREVTVGQVARMSYWTKTGATHSVNTSDWFMAIYTKPFTGGVSTSTWYGSRFGTEPYFSASIQDPANTWNLWSTNLSANTLRFFESTAGAPGANFGSFSDPGWAAFINGNSLGTTVHRAGQKVLFFSIQTGSAWANGFTGQLDGLRIELTDGSVATVNFEPDDTDSPIVANVAIAPNPAPFTTAGYTLTADATDNLAVTAAEYSVNGGTPVAFSLTPGASVSLSAVLGSLDVGVYSICVTARDAADNVSNTECTMLAVYDPNAGFVTGGGWFMSPAGAYVPDGTLTGKATFGFVSKYEKGKMLPTGNTQFQFKTGNVNFSSTSYEWLVVSGARAQYKGAGTINGTGDYRFMLTAIDGQVNGGGGIDKFRIRIWDNLSGGLIYDNMLNAPDSNEPTTALGGGSIVIHAPKK